jgi:bifunctional non-homologous end joining protein LigD
LNVNGPHWQTPETFDDGHALFDAVCEEGLEGIVAKRRSSAYRPGERRWVKIKNATTGGTNLSASRLSTSRE